jgi:hypothetical protein
MVPSVLDVGISIVKMLTVIDILSQIGKELEAESYKSAILSPLQILGVEIRRIPIGHPYDDQDRSIETVGDQRS